MLKRPSKLVSWILEQDEGWKVCERENSDSNTREVLHFTRTFYSLGNLDVFPYDPPASSPREDGDGSCFPIQDLRARYNLLHVVYEAFRTYLIKKGFHSSSLLEPTSMVFRAGMVVENPGRCSFPVSLSSFHF